MRAGTFRDCLGFKIAHEQSLKKAQSHFSGYDFFHAAKTTNAPRQPAPTRRARGNRNVFLPLRSRVNLPHVQNFFLTSVIKPLVSQREAGKNNQ